MSSTELPMKCKQRFKGVENFLRRIAFNLGNTPSQTEVKIISCIPIDVTDLQQKIICLEKQLEDARNGKGASTAPSSIVQTAFTRKTALQPCSKPTETCPTPQVERCEGCCLTHCISPNLFPPPPPKPAPCTCWSSDPSNADDPGQCDIMYRKGMFKKQKKKKDKNKKSADRCKTHLVYYAQTTNSPFSTLLSDKKEMPHSLDTDETMSHAYIKEMIRKQYMPVPIMQDVSIASEFSTPVCRDVEQSYASPNPHDSDVCSCCYGPFHNIDHHMPKHNHAYEPSVLPTCSFNERMNNTDFYDASLYDMVPVREKPTRITKSHYENPRRRPPKPPKVKVNPSYYYPERIRSKTKISPQIVNQRGRTPAVVKYSRNIPVKMLNAKEKVRRTSPRRDIVDERLQPSETSNSCCIDCGNVYIKRTVANKLKESPRPVTTSHKNAECLTSSLNDTECQTTTTQSVQIDGELLEEKKTEETLNQIKTILQSVLTEVKTNTQLKKVTEDKSTKDAVVQKGTSQGAMPGCSSLLHSYTYSPYNMNPYIASCSRQMTSGQCCYPTIPYPSAKCMQNFPVFIQTPGRHMCASCYRNSSHVPKLGQMKQATTAGTNTDTKERSKETAKLIKEIYKSITVNMDFPNKDTSASEYNDLKSTPRGSLNKSLYRSSVLDDGMRKFLRAKDSRNLQKTASPLSTLNGKLMSNTMSMRSQIVSTTDTERRLRNHRLENYLETLEDQKRQNKIQEEEREFEDVSPETTASDEEASSSEAEERVSYRAVDKTSKKAEVVQKTEPNKKGLFSKMLKSVKIFGNKTKKKKEEQIQVDNEVEEESEGNSDDYQTVCSQRVDRNPRYIPYPVRAVRSPPKIRAHSKISYSRHMRDRNQERSRRSPYMEQEYRRHWNERLMFHENQHRYSSEGPYSKESRRKPVYYQSYEARSALVRPRPVNLIPHAPQTNINRIVKPIRPKPDVNECEPKVKTPNKGLAWLKKHKLGIHCGPQWKKFILEG